MPLLLGSVPCPSGLLSIYRIWASVRLWHLDDWLKSWLLSSVFSAGGGRGSVEAWYSTALDFEEFLSGLDESHVHVFVKSGAYASLLRFSHLSRFPWQVPILQPSNTQRLQAVHEG